MNKLTITFLIVTVLSVTLAAPANNDQLDKANANDPFVNDVIAINKAKLTELSQSPTYPNGQPTPEFKPKPAGTMFARLIDDIFQIPIGVLQNVARLITNPFKHLQHQADEQKDKEPFPIHQ